jgi:hypothetical protein
VVLHTAALGLLLVVMNGLTGCLATRAPAAGRPLRAVPGRVVVFGRVAVVDDTGSVPPANPGSDWRNVGLGLHPELTLYLLRLAPRRIARPLFEGPGTFYWTLESGDYLLVGSPAADVGEPELAQRHWPLAAMRAAPADGVLCTGELSISAIVTTRSYVPEPAVQFDLGDVGVADRCEALTRDLERKYATLDSRPARRLWIPAEHLEFDDPALFERVRALLDAAQD